MTETNTTRRRFLLLAGTATSLTLAGCSTGSGATDRTTTQPATSEEHSGDTHHEDETGHHGGETTHHEDETGHHDGETATDSHEDHGTDTTVHEKADQHGGHGHGAPVGDPVEHAEVKMVTGDHGYHFEPHIVRVKPGGKVTFHNESGSHTATAYAPANDKPQRIPDGAEAWDSGTLTEQGATFEVTLDTEGVYDYYCAPHEQLGMIGSIIVGEPDAHGQPGLSEPSSDMPEKVRTKLAELNEKANKALGHTH